MEPRCRLPSGTLRPGPARLVPAIRLRATHGAREVHALQPRPGRGAGAERVEVEAAVLGVGDQPGRRAAVADAQRERPRVHARDAGHAAHAQPGVERRARAPVARLGRQALRDEAEGGDVGRLQILGVGPHVADMREGERDDLPGVARVRQRLLVAGHARIEADLAGLAVTVGAEAFAPEHGAVRENEGGRGAGRDLVGHGWRLLSRQRGEVGEDEAGRGDHGRPVLGGDRAGLAPLAHCFRANPREPRCRLGAAQPFYDLVHAGHGRELWEKTSHCKVCPRVAEVSSGAASSHRVGSAWRRTR